MRPVTKGGRETYPYEVDVSSQNNLMNTLHAIPIVCTGEPLKGRVEEVWGTNSPSAWQVLQGLLEYYLGHPPQNFTAVLATSLKGKLSGYYAKAAGPLEKQLGRFCSYCEQYYGAGLAVEHICPKTPYPLFYLAWDNFLLACPSCNSAKGNKPPRGNPPLNPEAEYFQRIKTTYLWPQWYSDSFKYLRPCLQCWENNQWEDVTDPIDAQNRVTVENVLQREIVADVLQKGQLKNLPVRVAYKAVAPRATELLTLLNLNRRSFNPARPGGEQDIRVWERTLQWFKVLESMRLLNQAPTKALFDAMWSMMMKWVSQPGIYSIWVAVIDYGGPNRSWLVPQTQEPVMDRFLNGIGNVFPGTDTANTPQ